jgi:hypothetical protein
LMPRTCSKVEGWTDIARTRPERVSLVALERGFQ